MPNKNYLRGRRLEYQVKKDLESRGWHVMRTAGSHGFADLIAVSPSEIMFIQCKVSKDSKAKKKLLEDLRKSNIIETGYFSCGCSDECYCPCSSMTISVKLAFKLEGESKYTLHSI